MMLMSVVLSLCCFVTIISVHSLLFNHTPLIIAAFGAAVFHAFASVEQRHVANIIGSVLAAFIGVSSNLLIPDETWKVIVAITISVFVMRYAGISYPPAGAICLIPTLEISRIEVLGYTYILYPVFTGICIIQFYSFIYNQLIYKSWLVKKRLK